MTVPPLTPGVVFAIIALILAVLLVVGVLPFTPLSLGMAVGLLAVARVT